jgi:hypothetical protein
MTSFLRLLTVGSLVAAAAAVSACSDPLRPTATLPTLNDTVTVYTLNTVIAGAPNALILFDGAATRADASFIFDIAFDIDASGKVVLYPPRKLAGLGGGHQVGYQVMTGSFEAIKEAPESGYARDTVLTLSPGTPITIEVADQSNCSSFFAFSPFIYSKLVVTGVDTAARKITLAYTVDRNCGFRSLETGIPTR